MRKLLPLALCLFCGQSSPAWQADFAEPLRHKYPPADDDLPAAILDDDAVKERYRQLEEAAAALVATDNDEGPPQIEEDSLEEAIDSFSGMYRNLTAREERQAMYNPMYWIDRSALRFASAPVVEIGFWREILYSFYRMKKTFVDNVVDFNGRPVTDRRVARRLRKVLEAGCDHLEPKTPDHTEADLLAETASADAKALASAMLIALPARSYLLPRIDLREPTLDTKKADGWSGRTLDEPYRHRRHFKTVDILGFPRLEHWGTLTYFEELGKALGNMDRVIPFSTDMLRLYKMIKPPPIERSQVAIPKIRAWKVSSGSSSAYDHTIELLALCLAQHELPY